MPIDQQVRISSITAAVLAGVAAIASSLAAWYAHNPSFHPTSHIDSPITASGGSMTFRGAGWICANQVGGMAKVYANCVAPANVSTVGADDVQDRMTPGVVPPDWPVPAKVTFHVRQTGALVMLCTSGSASADGTCGAGNFVQIQVSGIPYAGLIASSAVDGLVSAVQYYDAGCHVHGTTADAKTNDSPPMNGIPACEHPGVVDWPDGKSYLCKDGACRVYLK
jgi:hypothetical protein